jgi:quinoprotein relay system zinc metallohydrolase 2
LVIRDRSRAGASVLLGMALAFLAAPAPSQPIALPVVELAPGLYLHQGAQEDASAANGGDIANIGFVVGSERVAVIDTGGSLPVGLALRQAIRRVTELPIAYVILTHMHPDHVLGAGAFDADAPELIGHVNLADALARRGAFYFERAREDLGEAMVGTRVVMPTSGVEDTRELDLGGRVLELRAFPTAHTNNDLSILDRRTGTLWLSDLLFVGRTPALDGSLLGWLRVMETLSKADATRVVPGHGPVPTDWRGALAAQRRYLSGLAKGIREVIRRRGTLEEAVSTVGRQEENNWLLFDDYNGRNVTAAFVELEWE